MRTHHHGDFPIERMAERRSVTVSACVPTRECAETIGPIVRTLVDLRERGLLDEVVVVDAASADGTVRIAADAGATVHDEGALRPELGPVQGKGDALWRALGTLRGEVVCFLDGDTRDFGAHFAAGLLGPLLLDHDERVAFVKGFYRRPLGDDPVGGGRVNHLTARPALAVLFPELAAVRQPLAGEVAARRSLLERLPFATGYGVEVAMLIDAWRRVGLDGLAQVDLDVMVNPHQPLAALSRMAETVLRVVASRRGVEGVEPVPERPPLVAT